MAESSTLPRSWVERIFLRLQGVYGTQFTGKYLTGELINGRDIGYENAMHVWGDELSGFSNNGEAIAYALAHLDSKFPPNVKEFAEICRRAPKPELAKLPAPEARPEKVAEFASSVKTVTNKKKDFIGWARRPKSEIAFNSVLVLAKTDSCFAEIIEDLRAAGHVVGDSLKNRWDGSQWVRA